MAEATGLTSPHLSNGARPSPRWRSPGRSAIRESPPRSSARAPSRGTTTISGALDDLVFEPDHVHLLVNTLGLDERSEEVWIDWFGYIGRQHATMHLLYFRFWYRVMRELGLTQGDEPVQRLITQGIVNGPDGRKMSKRWGNVVAPSEIVSKYGASCSRCTIAVSTFLNPAPFR